MIAAAVSLVACLIAGDSLAVGVGAQFGGCVVSARVGAPTSAMPPMIPARTWDVVILSAGSNDAQAPDLDDRLRRLRARVHATRVVWILPYHRAAATTVAMIAQERGDAFLDAARFPSRDGIHPASYPQVAAALK